MIIHDKVIKTAFRKLSFGSTITLDFTAPIVSRRKSILSSNLFPAGSVVVSWCAARDSWFFLERFIPSLSFPRFRFREETEPLFFTRDDLLLPSHWVFNLFFTTGVTVCTDGFFFFPAYEWVRIKVLMIIKLY